MSRSTRYVAGLDLAKGEVLKDSRGREVDDAYVDRAVQDAVRKVRGRGRPSLSESGQSPLLRVRLSHELDDAVRRAAERAGESRADWVRHALDEAVRKTG